jgi:hypothetical protein
MKHRKKRPDDLLRRFEMTCGWCARKIPPDTDVFGGGGKARPEIDLTAHAGQVIPMRLVTLNKTVLNWRDRPGFRGPAPRRGLRVYDVHRGCGRSLKAAFEREIEIGKEQGLT